MARTQTPGETQSEWPGQGVAQWPGCSSVARMKSPSSVHVLGPCVGTGRNGISGWKARYYLGVSSNAGK